jgi:hypothetical protein
VFRRDHLLLTGPGFAGESWHNQVHDVVSGVAYGAMLAAPLVLAWRFRGDPDWAVVSRPVLLLALGSAVALVVFASRVVEPWNGVVQRMAVTLALGAEALTAARMLDLSSIVGKLMLKSASSASSPGGVHVRRSVLPGRGAHAMAAAFRRGAACAAAGTMARSAGANSPRDGGGPDE